MQTYPEYCVEFSNGNVLFRMFIPLFSPPSKSWVSISGNIVLDSEDSEIKVKGKGKVVPVP
jgi:hypothetical protein